MKERLWIGLLLAAVALVYGNTLRSAFTMDDGLYIVDNPQVTSPSLSMLLKPNVDTHVFRPLTFATFSLNWAVSGPHPLAFHLFNIVLHAAVTLLLYLLLRTILAASPNGKAVALATAFLFAVHPIHTEAVASIVGRAELLAAGFLLAAWILHLRDREIPALICFLLALLSKESAVAFLPLVLIGDYARGKWKPPLRYARLAGATLLYLGLVWEVQGGHFPSAGLRQLDNPLTTLPATWRMLNALRVSWKYVGLHVYPAALSCDYSFNQIPVYRDWRHLLPAGFGAVIAAGAWFWAIRERHRGLVLAGGIYIASFATTANLLMPIGTIMGERLAYLPSAGFCLMVALGLIWLKDRKKVAALGVFAALLAALATRTVVRNRDWKDNLALYSAGVQAAPDSAKMRFDLGNVYMYGNRWDLARQEFEAALRIYPDYFDALSSYGVLESWMGDDQAAGRMLERAVDMHERDNPNYDLMAVNLAVLLIKTGHADGALDLLDTEIAESPRYSRAWSNRAAIHFKRGETALARADAEAALRLDSSNGQAQSVLKLLNSRPPGVNPK